MPVDKIRIGLAFAAVAFVFSLLMMLSWEFARDAVVAPIYYFLRACVFFLKSLPYKGYLAVLVCLLLIISLDTMQRIRHKQADGQLEESPPQTDSRYLHWRRFYENQQYNWFLRNKFALEVRQLLLSLLAFQVEKEPVEIEAMIKEGTLSVPDSVKYLIQHQAIQSSQPASNFLQNARSQQYRASLETDSQLDPLIDDQVAEIVSFIEQCLEINHVGNRPSA